MNVMKIDELSFMPSELNSDQKQMILNSVRFIANQGLVEISSTSTINQTMKRNNSNRILIELENK